MNVFFKERQSRKTLGIVDEQRGIGNLGKEMRKAFALLHVMGNPFQILNA